MNLLQNVMCRGSSLLVVLRMRFFTRQERKAVELLNFYLFFILNVYLFIGNVP